jgi:hypothetical protein
MKTGVLLPLGLEAHTHLHAGGTFSPEVFTQLSQTSLSPSGSRFLFVTLTESTGPAGQSLTSHPRSAGK